MKINAVITLTAVQPNAPPQYTGPLTISDLVVGQGRALQGFDPDGDRITWGVGEGFESLIGVSPDGILTPLVALQGQAVTVTLDDGRP